MPIYELFGTNQTAMTWTLLDNIKGEVVKEEQYRIEKAKPNVLVFCDLIYYHDTKSENIKVEIWKQYYKTKKRKYDEFLSEIRNFDVIDKKLRKNVTNMIEYHINEFDPKLIVVTNAFASQLIYGTLKNEKQIENKSILNFKYKGIPIIFSGMVSQFMDNFSKERLKRDINETMKDLEMI